MNETTYTDKETGEVFTTSKIYRIPVPETKFYMTYIESLAGVFNLKSAVDIKVLIKMCMIAEYNSGRVLVTAQVRREIIESIGICSPAISRAIDNLKTLQLVSGSQGTYYLNPAVFWRGENKVRDEMLKNNVFKVTFEFTGE